MHYKYTKSRQDKQLKGEESSDFMGTFADNHYKITISFDRFWSNITLSFPTKEMAKDFLGCFRDLCETAKILL